MAESTRVLVATGHSRGAVRTWSSSGRLRAPRPSRRMFATGRSTSAGGAARDGAARGAWLRVDVGAAAAVVVGAARRAWY